MKVRIALLFCILMTIAVVHTVSIEFYLYWKYLWLDIPMHTLGGIACALGFSILPFFNIILPSRYTSIYGYVWFALGIGIVWEIFEFSAGISIIEPGFVFDTLKDLSMDSIGAIGGYFFIRGSNVMIE